MSALFDHTMIKMGIENREGSSTTCPGHYYPRLKSYVSSFVEDSVAEDITQDVFLYVFGKNRKKSMLVRLSIPICFKRVIQDRSTTLRDKNPLPDSHRLSRMKLRRFTKRWLLMRVIYLKICIRRTSMRNYIPCWS